ncbi:MAG: phosphatase PAP2 family protein [Polyangiales bacterium]
MTFAETFERSPTTRHVTLGAIVLGGLGVFAAALRTIQPVRGNRFDRALMRSAGRMRSPFANVLMRAITALGGPSGATTIAVGSVVLARKNHRAAFQLGVGALGGAGAELGLKQAFGRPRPTQLLHLERVTGRSFPSGHAMGGAAIYLTIAYVAARRWPHHRGALLVGAGAIAGSIALSRVYLGVHWPTDVVGGLALGTAWASAVEAAFDASTLSRAPEATYRPG